MIDDKVLICYPLHYAVRFNDLPLLNKCIERGDDINVIDHDKNTPLHLAYLLNRLDFTTILLEHGANPDLLNIDDKKAIELLN